jgi:protein-glutamine gamma-glutamyltransferase
VSPDERCSLRQHALPLLAAAASAAALMGAEIAQQGTWGEAFPLWLMGMATMLAAAAWFRRCARSWASPPSISPLILLLLVSPFPIEWVLRQLGTTPHPLEVVLILGAQLAACGLAAAGVWQRHQPLALIASLFVTMFSVTLAAEAVTVVAAAVYLLSGLAWMITTHWASLEQRMASRQQQRLPWKIAALPVALLLIMVAGVGVVSKDRMWSLDGWVPSSGGSGQDDPAAWRGVGDGEALVAGEEDIQSFGPIENAPFRASEDPSLYDLFNELYDEPVVRNKNQDRAIALPPDTVQQLETQMAKSQRATKEFSTQRKSRSKSPSAMKDLASDALFYVKGRTPLHLRQQLYDVFDGSEWYSIDPAPGEAERFPKLEIQESGKRPWLRWNEPLGSFELFGPMESHAIKVVHLKTNRIPTPFDLRGVHLDQLDKPDFFLWADHRILQMDRLSLPELTAIHLQSQTMDPSLLREWKNWSPTAHARYRLLPSIPEMDRVKQLAQAWVEGLPRGSAQVSAIAQRLRRDYELDMDTKPPEDVACPVAHFLFESRRGPDYLFATAAALMLRSLDYSTRMVGGFYASPERFDSKRQHTPVVSADAHLWVEVHLSGQQWITVEPTPGYDVLRPPPGWLEWGVQLALSAMGWVVDQAIPLTFAAIAAVCAWWWRKPLQVWLAWLQWRWWAAPTSRRRILQTMRFVERCWQLAGLPRPAGCPPGRWAQRLSQRSSEPLPLADLENVGRLVDWACYAPESAPMPGPFANGWSPLCERVALAVRDWTHRQESRLNSREPELPSSLPPVLSPAPAPVTLVPLTIRNVTP